MDQTQLEHEFRSWSVVDVERFDRAALKLSTELSVRPSVDRRSLDPLPLFLTTEDFRFLEAAFDQWGRLLTHVYRDVFGRQDLVRSGAISPEALWKGGRFEPSFHGAVPSYCEPLGTVRFDVRRTLAGAWELISLGTDVAHGIGFALENRVVHSRALPSTISNNRVVRLAPYFQDLKARWFSQSLTHKDEPTIMVWTAGPTDPYYFEHAYLSRYFGYPLVESRDLTVRSGKLFLKTLGGLTPVDVLLRTTSDRELDPLVAGTFSGVAALTQVVRDGAVFVTNAPGTSFLEHKALMSSYGDLASRVLGEPLAIAPRTTENEYRTADFWSNGAWRPAPFEARFFVSQHWDGWKLLPGGLVRAVAEPSGSLAFAPRANKDVWFLSDRDVPPVTLIPVGEKPIEINRAADLPSRVADDLFWLGRYTERAWVDLRWFEKSQGERAQEALQSLVSSIRSIESISAKVLDRMSLETHRIFADLGTLVADEDPKEITIDVGPIALRLAAFCGLSMESMTRNPGWRFLDMGRRFERAQLVVEGVVETLESAELDDALARLLDVFDSTLTYRSRYRLSPQLAPVLDLLLLDESNPRSAAFQVERLNHHVQLLPRTSTRAYKSSEERSILDLMTRLRLCDATTLDASGRTEFLEALSLHLETFYDALHQTYLAKIDSMEALQARGSAYE